MALIAPAPASTIEYPPTPNGLHNAVISEVRDLGLQDRTWQGKTTQVPMVLVIFELDAEYEYEDKEGNTQSARHLAFKRETFSMGEKANLRKLVHEVDRRLSDAEARSYDLEQIVGKRCSILTQQNEGRDGKIYVNIKAITPPAAGNDMVPLRTPKDDDEGGSEAPAATSANNDEDVPF